MAIVKNRFLRIFILGIGWISVGLGLAGVFLPLLPTTPFILLAAWCFMKSSASAHVWIYSHPVLGKALTDWETKRAISRSTKVIAVCTILLSVALIWLKVHDEWIRNSVTLLLTGVSIFILTRKSA